jgi:hypothetical protein
MTATMTADALIEAIRRLTAEAIAKGHEFMILSLAGPRKRQRRKRVPNSLVTIAKGLYGRWMGDIDEPGKTGFVVDVAVDDAKAWLKRRGVAMTAPLDVKRRAEGRGG